MSDNTLDNKALDLLFREARSQNAYVNAPLTDDMLKELYDLWKHGPPPPLDGSKRPQDGSKRGPRGLKTARRVFQEAS